MKKRMIIAVAIVAILMIASIAGVLVYEGNVTGISNTGTITVMDASGNKVTFSSAPTKIVSLGNSFTETLIDLGAVNDIYGVDGISYADYFCSNYSDIFGPGRTSYYAFLNAHSTVTNFGNGTWGSDLVEECVANSVDCVLIWDYPAYYGSLISELQAAHIPVVALDPTNIPDVLDTIALLGKVTNENTNAIGLVGTMGAEMDQVTVRYSNAAYDNSYNLTSIYFELQSSNTVSDDTITGNIIEMAGGWDIYGNSSNQYPEPSYEFVVEDHPSVVVVESAVLGVKSVSEIQQETNATLIYSIPSSEDTTTPSVVYALYAMAYILHPDLFPQFASYATLLYQKD